jgi:hypothetical protein
MSKRGRTEPMRVSSSAVGTGGAPDAAVKRGAGAAQQRKVCMIGEPIVRGRMVARAVSSNRDRPETILQVARGSRVILGLSNR